MEIEPFESTNKRSIVKGDKKSEIIYYLFHFNFNLMFKGQILFYTEITKYVTLRNKFSKIPLSNSIHFATRERNSRVIRLSLSSCFFVRAAATKTRVGKSSPVSTFLLSVSLFVQPHTKKYLTKTKC